MIETNHASIPSSNHSNMTMAENTIPKNIDDFKNLYNLMNRENLSIELIKSVYGDDIHFQDCFHSIDGIKSLYDYFDNLYSNVSFIQFNFINQWNDDNSAMITWEMTYKHPKLNQGKNIVVKGASELTFENNKIIKHRDYFDAGSLLYEHIPLLKRIIIFLKNRMA